MLRTPLRRRRSCFQSVVVARAFSPSISRARYRGQAAALSTCTGNAVSTTSGTAVISGPRTMVLLITATSRAMPATHRQSPRFGVRPSSMLTSSNRSAARKSVPGANSAGSIIKPSALSARPSSFAEHNMPSETTPRSLDFSMRLPPGKCAPITARVHAAKTQSIGVGVRLDAQHLSHHHTAERRRHRFHGVHFQSRHRELMRQLRRGDGGVHPFTQPLFAEFHPSNLFITNMGTFVERVRGLTAYEVDHRSFCYGFASIAMLDDAQPILFPCALYFAILCLTKLL